jgi:hypothetical protein
MTAIFRARVRGAISGLSLSLPEPRRSPERTLHRGGLDRRAFEQILEMMMIVIGIEPPH